MQFKCQDSLNNNSKNMERIKIGWILIFLLLHTIVVNAQQVHSLWFNVVSGINSNWILNQNAYGNPEFEYATSFGLTGGMGATYFYKKHWGLNGSLLLTQMGQNYSGVQSGGEAERKVKLTYLEAPLLIMKTIPYMRYPTWISVGTDFMFLLNANQEYSREGGNSLPNPDGMIDGNVKNRYKPFDIGLTFSLNRLYNLDYSRKMMFLFAVNSTFGLTDINSTDWQTPNMKGEYSGSHNFYIGIKAGIMFKVAKLGGRSW